MFFLQDLDHFHPTDGRTWKQRYFVNASLHRRGGPVFLMIGGEGEANSAWMSHGTWMDYAKEFGALCFQLEHRWNCWDIVFFGGKLNVLLYLRFYGKSRPTSDMSVKNLVYLSSEQALADIATFIDAMNREYNLTDSRWIAFGGSYPGIFSKKDIIGGIIVPYSYQAPWLLGYV